MGQQDYMRTIRRIETEFPVERWTIDGMAVWPLLRIHGLFDSRSAFSAPVRPTRLSRLLDSVRREAGSACAALGRGWRSHATPCRQVDALMFGDGVSYIRPSASAAWYDRFCDPLREQLDESGRRHVMLVPGRARHPLVRPAWFIHNHLRYALLRAPAAPGRQDLPGFAEAADLLEHEHGWRPTTSWLLRHVRRINAYAWWYGRQLDRLRPRVVFLVSYYSNEGFALLHAANRRGLVTVDLQHGTQGEIHPAYAAFAKMPAGGWGLLPRRFWVWSEAEAQAIRAWGGSWHGADVVGNALLDRQLCQAADGPLSDRPKVLLITLQNGFDDAGYYRLLGEIIAALPDDMAVWVRIHPVQMPGLERIAAAFAAMAPRCRVEEPSRSPLYSILPQASVHLTHSSSTVIEAAALGVPSVVFDALGAALYHEHIATGSAVLATSPGEIATQIIRLASAPRLREDRAAAAKRRSTLIKRLDEFTRPLACASA